MWTGYLVHFHIRFEYVLQSLIDSHKITGWKLGTKFLSFFCSVFLWRIFKFTWSPLDIVWKLTLCQQSLR